MIIRFDQLDLQVVAMAMGGNRYPSRHGSSSGCDGETCGSHPGMQNVCLSGPEYTLVVVSKIGASTFSKILLFNVACVLDSTTLIAIRTAHAQISAVPKTQARTTAGRKSTKRRKKNQVRRSFVFFAYVDAPCSAPDVLNLNDQVT